MTAAAQWEVHGVEVSDGIPTWYCWGKRVHRRHAESLLATARSERPGVEIHVCAESACPWPGFLEATAFRAFLIGFVGTAP